MSSTPEPAPLGLRLRSAGLHALAGTGLMAIAGVALGPILPSQSRREQWFSRWEPWMRRRQMTQLWPRALRRRGGRSWLARSIDLRVVDARTGGPVTVSSALRLEIFDATMTGLGNVVWGPRMARQQEQRRAAEAAVRAELAAELPDDTVPDEAAVARAVIQRMSGDTSGWGGTCLPLVVFRFVVPLLTIPVTRRRQSLDQWFAGVMVVRAPSTASRPNVQRR